MGLEVCTTLGMLNAEQAKQLKEAGLTAYNHNLDTSREVSHPQDKPIRSDKCSNISFSLSPVLPQSHYDSFVR